MARKQRRSFEAGHRPKFLVVIDETAECSRAVRFAARRAGRLDAGLAMLAVVEPQEGFEWLGIGEMMRAETEAKAMARLEEATGWAKKVYSGPIETQVRTGDKAEQITRLIEDDEDISYFMLAAGTENETPGPLVTLLTGRSGAFPIAIVIVPGGLSDSEIDALAG